MLTIVTGGCCAKEKCTGCGACEQICPKSAIKMDIHNNGYWYPSISQELCIDCGKCYTICQQRKEKAEIWDPKAYVGWSNDAELRFRSTSGAAFSEIAKLVIEKGGVVVGAAYEGKNVIHQVCSTYGGLSKLRQSKYVQSSIGDTYLETRKLLDSGKKVLFSGTPCQIAGLLAFLGKRREGLVTVSFICRGVCSPVAFRKWVGEYEEKIGSEVRNVWFKHKVDGWKASPRNIYLEFQNGESINVSGSDNLYMSAYLDTNVNIRPSCGNCDFKGTSNMEDITLGDYWGAPEKYDDDKGTSVMIVNSKLGHKYVEDLKTKNRMNIYECEYDNIVRGNPMLVHSVDRATDSDIFIDLLGTHTFSEAYDKCKND